MTDPNQQSLIIDPRFGGLLVSASGGLGATPGAPPGEPLDFGPPAAPGETGTFGHFRVVRELGRGAMGAVFQAVDTRLDRWLALKVMLPALAAAPEARERFLREARLAARIAHDHVVTVYDANEHGGVPYITMQLLQGSPLDAFLQKKGGPSLRHMVRIAREAALGLAAAHALGVVHRDIKPANLWLEAPHGRVKLLDFGLARPDAADHELTKSGAVVGTPAFMSPEQALGERVDHRTDLFSLGAVLYWLCTGRLPFPGPSVVAVLMALGTEDPTPVPALNPGVPPPLADLVHQLLAKDPAGRPQTAAAVAGRLQDILDREADLSAPVPATAPGGAAPSAMRTGTDPWATRALSGAAQQGRPSAPLSGEPNVLRSMPVVAIAPAARPPEPPQDEPPGPQKSAPRPLRTVISSGVVWEEAPDDERDEGTGTRGPGRPRRRRAAEREDDDRDEPQRKRPRGRAREKGGNGVPIFGVAAVVLGAVIVAVALVVAGKPKPTDTVQPKGGEPPEGPGTVRREPVLPDARRPVAPGPRVERAPGAEPPVPVIRQRLPTILGWASTDPRFKAVGPEGALLVGVVARFEKFRDREIVRAVRPIYRVDGREEYGPLFGDNLTGAVTMRARDGYAVGGIVGHNGQWCNGFALSYMRVKRNGALDPGDSYEGEWGGYRHSSDPQRVSGSGVPAVGIVGKTVGPQTSAFGLLFRGQEGWNPEMSDAATAPPWDAIFGNNSDPKFRDEAPPGGLLVGFDVWYGTVSSADVVDGVRPIYRTAGQDSLGHIHGRETARGTRVVAQPGYAVGGVTVNAGTGLNALTVLYMRVQGARLNPVDSYESTKLGGPGGDKYPILGGNGRLIMGIIGRKNSERISGLGLAYSTTK